MSMPQLKLKKDLLCLAILRRINKLSKQDKPISVKDMCDDFGWCQSSVRGRILLMKKEGWIHSTRREGKSSKLQLLDAGKRVIRAVLS